MDAGTGQNIYLAGYNGSNTFINTAGGNVGIGTTSPSYKLLVNGTLGTAGWATIGDGQTGRLNLEVQATFHRMAFNELRFFDWNAGGDNMTINNGFVGIGETAPDDRLSVVAAGGRHVKVGGGANTGSELKLTNSGSAHFSVYNSGNSRLTFANTSSLFQTNSAGTVLGYFDTAGNLNVTGTITGGPTGQFIQNQWGGNQGASFHISGSGRAGADFRAPIFYDENNTAFYTDPNGTSLLNKLRVDGNGATSGHWGHDPYGYGWGAPYASFRNLEVSSSGNFSNEPAMLRIHQWGSGAAEFWKPQGTTLYLRETPGGSGTWFNTFEIQGNERVTGEIYYNNWIRHMTGSQSGLYWQEGVGQNWHIYPANQQDMIMRTGAGNGGIMGTISDATARGYVHWTTGNEIGFLDHTRNWQLRSYDGGGELYDIWYGNDFRPYIIYDRNNTGFYWNGDGESRSYRAEAQQGWGTWVQYDANDGNYQVDPNGRTDLNDLRANIMYDHNDFNFYADPNGVSYFNDFRPNIIYDRNNTAFYWNGDGTSRSNYWNTGPNDSWFPYTNNWNYFRGSTYAWNAVWYDENDGAYYLDPNGTSRFNVHQTNVLNFGMADYGGLPSTVDGTLYRRSGQAEMGFDDWFYMRDVNDDQTTIRFNVDNNYVYHHVDGGDIYSAHGHDYYGRAHQTSGFSFDGWGVHLENYYSESGGFHADYDQADIWSPGDGDRLLRIWDEDGMVERAYFNGSGTYYNPSDINKKQNINRVTSALSKIEAISGYTYEFKKNAEELAKGDLPKLTAGVIAQEVEEVMPELVDTDEEGNKFMNYSGLAPYLIEAIKEQQKEIEQLSTRTVNVSDFGVSKVSNESVWVSFSSDFIDQNSNGSVPVVTATPLGNGVISIIESSTDGFRVQTSENSAEVTFNWIAMVKVNKVSYEPHNTAEVEAIKLKVETTQRQLMADVAQQPMVKKGAKKWKLIRKRRKL